MRKRLNSLLGTLILVPSILVGCNSPYQPKIIERRDVPTLNDSAGRWQTFYYSIDAREATKDELEFVNHYSSLNKEQRKKYVGELTGILEQLSPEVEARKRNGKLTNIDLTFIYNVYKNVEDSFKGKIHF